MSQEVAKTHLAVNSQNNLGNIDTGVFAPRMRALAISATGLALIGPKNVSAATLQATVLDELCSGERAVAAASPANIPVPANLADSLNLSVAPRILTSKIFGDSAAVALAVDMLKSLAPHVGSNLAYTTSSMPKGKPEVGHVDFVRGLHQRPDLPDHLYSAVEGVQEAQLRYLLESRAYRLAARPDSLCAFPEAAFPANETAWMDDPVVSEKLFEIARAFEKWDRQAELDDTQREMLRRYGSLRVYAALFPGEVMLMPTLNPQDYDRLRAADLSGSVTPEIRLEFEQLRAESIAAYLRRYPGERVLYWDGDHHLGPEQTANIPGLAENPFSVSEHMFWGQELRSPVQASLAITILRREGKLQKPYVEGATGLTPNCIKYLPSVGRIMAYPKSLGRFTPKKVDPATGELFTHRGYLESLAKTPKEKGILKNTILRH